MRACETDNTYVYCGRLETILQTDLQGETQPNPGQSRIDLAGKDIHNAPMPSSKSKMAVPDRGTTYRYSGHDTFQCRYAWLPKAVKLIGGQKPQPDLFDNEDHAMVSLGVGKNMVRSIAFWAETAGVLEGLARNMVVTEFGRVLLGHEGHDEYLENIQTLWLLHWKIATNPQPLFAWDFLLNHWHRPDFSRREAVQAFIERSTVLGKNLSENTLETHFDVFLHTYLPTRSRKGLVLEDNLDCPLVELRLLKISGERISTDSARREPTYSFRTEEKPEISDELFIYCLDQFWKEKSPNSETLPFREVSVGAGSPGQVFKLPERWVRERLDRIQTESKGTFAFDDSASLQQVRRMKKTEPGTLLGRVYDNAGD